MGSYNNYDHFVPKADKNHKFPKEYSFVLIDEVEELEEELSKAGDYIAWDLETTGLSPRVDKIVGIAFSWNDKSGYYIPLRHRGDGNIDDVEKAMDLFYEALVGCKKSFVYNMRFDYRFMEFANFDEYDIDEHIKDNLLGFMDHHGYDMSKVDWYDVAIPVWLADTNKKMPSLKWACFTGDTEIRTNKGLVEIRKINPDIHKVSIGDNEFDIKDTHKEIKDIVEIELSNGDSIRCTSDHRFLCKGNPYKWVRADNLLDEDIITEDEINNMGLIDEILAWLKENS